MDEPVTIISSAFVTLPMTWAEESDGARRNAKAIKAMLCFIIICDESPVRVFRLFDSPVDLLSNRRAANFVKLIDLNEVGRTTLSINLNSPTRFTTSLRFTPGPEQNLKMKRLLVTQEVALVS
jgi:hypothetical protein